VAQTGGTAPRLCQVRFLAMGQLPCRGVVRVRLHRPPNCDRQGGLHPAQGAHQADLVLARQMAFLAHLEELRDSRETRQFADTAARRQRCGRKMQPARRAMCSRRVRLLCPAPRPRQKLRTKLRMLLSVSHIAGRPSTRCLPLRRRHQLLIRLPVLCQVNDAQGNQSR